MDSNITLQLINNMTSINSTNVDEPWSLSSTGKTSMIIAYSLVAAIGVPGNLLIIIILQTKTSSGSSSDTFMMSLSVCDFLASICMPLVMINDLVSLEWKYGAVGCKIMPSFNSLSIFASAWSLVVISVDRLRVVFYPFRARLSIWIRILTIASVWVASFAATIPYANVLSIEDGLCWDHWNTAMDQFNYFISFMVFTCVFPTIIMAVCYGIALYKLKSSESMNMGELQEHRKRRENKRILKMFILIVSVFVFLTTPYFILVAVIVYTAAYEVEYFDKHINILYELNYGLFTMAAFNSCANCFIYSKMHTEIRKRIRGSKVSPSGTVKTQSIRSR